MSNALACSPDSKSSIGTVPASAPMSRAHVLRRNLKRSVLDGGYYGWMVGVGETYIPAFALAIGLGEVTAGLIASVPMLAGGIVQLVSLRAIHWCGSYRRWIVLASTIQAAAFVPLIVAAMIGKIPPWMLFLFVSIYWGSGMAAGPAWNAWIGNIVPNAIRPRYFAKRTRLIQLATFSGFLFGGLLIYWTNQAHAVLVGFATLFLLAAIARAISTIYLYRHEIEESVPETANGPYPMLRSETFSPIGKRLIVYLVCMQIFVQFSGPYFVPYMFKKLAFSYEAFVLLTGAAFVSKALSLPLWGAIASRKGGRFLLGLGGVGVIPLSSLWTLSDHFGWLVFVQVASGATWAAYELGFFLVFMNHVSQKQRAQLMTIYNFANSLAWFSGSLMGGWLLTLSHASYESYHLLFWLSSLGRLLALGLLWRVQHCPEDEPHKMLRRSTANARETTSHVDVKEANMLAFKEISASDQAA